MQVGLVSPLSVDELLFKNPAEVIEELVSFQETSPIGPSREGLIQSVTTAASRNYEWGWRLGHQLAVLDDAAVRALHTPAHISEASRAIRMRRMDARADCRAFLDYDFGALRSPV
jgi:hypothetical protein